MTYIPVQVFGKLEYVNTEKIVKVTSYMYDTKEYARIKLADGASPIMTSELVTDVMKRLKNPEEYGFLTEEEINKKEADDNNKEFITNQIGFKRS